MDDAYLKTAEVFLESETQSLEVMKRLMDAAKPEAVFSKPVIVGDQQVITASEINVGMGFGFGLGSGPRLLTNLESESESFNEETGLGSGGGGGGGAGARPVAVITIDGDQVSVQPILDMTKIALAFLTMLGSIFLLGSQIRKQKK
jgi:uncharacterized spore protein YtfJ